MGPREKIFTWAAQGHVSPQDLPAALKLAGVLPEKRDWLKFLDHLLLGLGTALLVSGIVFFFAANWSALERFSRFALVESALLLSLVAAWRLGESPGGKAARLASVLLVGVLLALTGQTYQTGADSWELFATWSLLVLPWVLLEKDSLLWFTWVILANLSAITYVSTYSGFFSVLLGPDELLWILFILNTLALAIWQTLTSHKALNTIWPLRLLATASGVFITLLAFKGVVDRPVDWTAMLVWITWLAGIHWVYRRHRPDLYVLAGAVFSMVVVISGFVGYFLLRDFHAGSLLLMTFVILSLSASGGWWLRQRLKELQQ